MTATRLNLSEDLKRRIVRLAASANKTPHAFMVDVLSQEADRAETRGRFSNDAVLAENEALKSGKAFPLDVAFDYLEARAAGKVVRRPRTRP
jgi:predicted transcriptional regulator